MSSSCNTAGSGGGTFQLMSLTNSKLGMLLTSTPLLNRQLARAAKAKRRMGEDPTPTLADVERTHIVHVNPHFKPYVDVALEYLTQSSKSGFNSWDNHIDFEIPQMGDFFSDMAMSLVIDEVTTTQGAAPLTADAVADSATLPNVADAYVGTGAATYVDAYGRPLGPLGVPGAAEQRNFVRYCAYPGLRILESVKFSVNGNPLDCYSRNSALMYHKFSIGEDKRHGFNRLVGHENPVSAVSDVNSFNGVSSLPDVGAGTAFSDETLKSDTSRRKIEILNGLQTPKLTQPKTRFLIPILLWFCKDFRLSMPSVSIPNGQRYLKLKLARMNEIIQTVPGNAYVKSVQNNGVVDQISIAKPLLFSDSVLSATPNIQSQLIINNLYVNPEIHDIFLKRIGFNLIRIHQEHAQTLNTQSANIRLDSFRWCIETLFVGFRPSENISTASGASNHLDDWAEFGVVNRNSSDCPSTLTNDGTLIAGMFGTAAAGGSISNINACNRYHYKTISKPVDSFQLDAYGNKLYESFVTQFYNSYIPFTYGGANIVTPKDTEVHMVTFCLYPGTYQPSGCINVSRAREFNLCYQSTHITSSKTVDLFILADSINFLLISDGSAVLRYST